MTGPAMNQIFDGIMIAIQFVILYVLIREGRSLSHQLKEARRDTIIRIRMQLGEIYRRYLNEPNKPLKENSKQQMTYLMSSYDELSKYLGDTQEDEFLRILRQICSKPKEQE